MRIDTRPLPFLSDPPSPFTPESLSPTSSHRMPNSAPRSPQGSLKDPLASLSLRPCTAAALPSAALSPRDLHPIKFFLTPSEASEDRPRTTTRYSRHYRQRGSSQDSPLLGQAPSGVSNPILRELEQLESEEEEEDEVFARSKSEGGLSQFRRPGNPILRELQSAEGVNRSSSVDAPERLKGTHLGRKLSNPILRDLELDYPDPALLTSAPVDIQNLKRVQPKQSQQRAFLKHRSYQEKAEALSSDDEDERVEKDHHSRDSGSESSFEGNSHLSKLPFPSPGDSVQGQLLPLQGSTPSGEHKAKDRFTLGRRMTADRFEARLREVQNAPGGVMDQFADNQQFSFPSKLMKQETVPTQQLQEGASAAEFLKQDTEPPRRTRPLRVGIRNTMQHWMSDKAENSCESSFSPSAFGSGKGGAEDCLSSGDESAEVSCRLHPRWMPQGAVPRFLHSPRRSFDSKDGTRTPRGQAGAQAPVPDERKRAPASPMMRGVFRARLAKQESFGAGILQRLDVLDARNLLRRHNSAAPEDVFSGVQHSESSLGSVDSSMIAGLEQTNDHGFGSSAEGISRLGLSSMQQVNLGECRG